jgi:hypothetical protein
MTYRIQLASGHRLRRRADQPRASVLDARGAFKVNPRSIPEDPAEAQHRNLLFLCFS